MKLEPCRSDRITVRREWEGVFSSSQLMHGMGSQKGRQFGLVGDDMFPTGHEEAATAQHPSTFANKLREITRVMKELPRVHDVDALIGQGYLLTGRVEQFDPTVGVQAADGSSTDLVARVRLQCDDAPRAIRDKGKRRDARARADIEHARARQLLTEQRPQLLELR